MIEQTSCLESNNQTLNDKIALLEQKLNKALPKVQIEHYRRIPYPFILFTVYWVDKEGKWREIPNWGASEDDILKLEEKDMDDIVRKVKITHDKHL